MKKLSLMLALALVLGMLPFAASATEAAYAQSPILDAQVESGALPPVADRLPENPKLVKEAADEYLTYEIGNYGGTLRLVTPSVGWSSDCFIGLNEALLSMSSSDSDEILPNIVESYSANEDNTVFTFTLRKGLRWSDGAEVTMDDFAFAINDFVFNQELNPVVAAYMRDGGSSAGDPFTFTVVDDQTFTLSFKSSFGGFLVHLSVNGWKGYTDLLKPAHYLKPFHKAYADECHGSLEAYYEFIAPFAAVLGYDDPAAEGVWTYVFNALDMTNWEIPNPSAFLATKTFADLIDQNMPVLYGWLMQSDENGVITYVRNPYYFKVDAAGQQLPYIDSVTTTLVENAEMVQLKTMTGECDFLREAASVDNISLYREHAEDAHIAAYITGNHGNPMPIYVNATYGLNPDGSVKDDDASKAWQEVLSDKRFLSALTMAIDAQEIGDSVYKGLVTLSPYFDCRHDIAGAKALLDEMGMVDLDGDGYRETPSGLPLQWQFWNSGTETNTYWVPMAELLIEYWREIGLNVSIYTTANSLLATSAAANEVPMQFAYNDAPTTWWINNWNLEGWAPLWSKWVTAGGLSGVELDPAQYLEPPQEVKDFLLLAESLLTVDAATAVNEVYPAVRQAMADMKYLITPIQSMDVCVVINSDIGNVPTGGIAIGWGFMFEQFYYKSFQY